MKAITIFMGVLLTIGGFFCMLAPISTFRTIGWAIGVVLLIAGINLVIDFFTHRKGRGVTGWDLLGGLLTVALALFILYRHGYAGNLLDELIIILFGVWMLFSGVFRIAGGMRLKELGEKSWVWIILSGAVSLVLGIYGLINPYVFKFAIGWMIGFFVIMQGINMLTLAFAMNSNTSIDDDATVDDVTVDDVPVEDVTEVADTVQATVTDVADTAKADTDAVEDVADMTKKNL